MLNCDDKLAIIDRIHMLMVAADHRDWPVCLECFAPDLVIDYSAFTGQPAETVSSQILVDRWKALLPGFESTQHLVTNHRVRELDGGAAECESYVYAAHYLPNEIGEPIWIVAGAYRHELVQQDGQWRIRYMKLTLNYQSGNLRLPELAMRRLQPV